MGWKADGSGDAITMRFEEVLDVDGDGLTPFREEHGVYRWVGAG